MEINDVVSELNSDLYEIHGETEMEFGLLSNGHSHVVSFGGATLWSSEDDDREWIEEENDYEPLIPYLKKRLSDYADKVQSLKF